MPLTDLRKQVAQKNEEAFTLIELMAVVFILGLLAAIAIPVFIQQQQDALAGSIRSDVRNTVTNVATWVAANPSGLSGTQQGELNLAEIDIVQTPGNSIWIVSSLNGAPRYNDYVVNGLNPNFDGRYTFTSTTGSFTDTLNR